MRFLPERNQTGKLIQRRLIQSGVLVAISTFVWQGYLLWIKLDLWMKRPRVQVTVQTLNVDGLIREYRMSIPDRMSSNPRAPFSRYPIVVALHGALDTTEDMAKSSKLEYLAAQHGFLLVFPQGRMFNWPPDIPEENPEHIEPDLRFFEQLCDRVVRKHLGDPNRIYVVGVSQGGAMVNLLVAKCSQKIAAAVSSCGWMPKPLDTQRFETAYKTPILFLAGSEDQQVPPSAVRQAHDVFEAMGHRVEFKIIPGAGHGWHPDKVNDSVWTFLSSAKRSP